MENRIKSKKSTFQGKSEIKIFQKFLGNWDILCTLYHMELILGILYGLLAQILTFLQLQGNIKWGFLQKYPILTLLSAVPLSYLFLKSVEYLVKAFDGQIWPSRLIGFSIGIIVFGLMSYFIFKEPLTLKTIVCLILGMVILGIQILWR